MKDFFLKYRYLIVVASFLLWIVFFDQNSLLDIRKIRKEIRELEKQEKYYINEIKEVKKQRDELRLNDKSLEKYARENYLMKKDNEDIYIFE